MRNPDEVERQKRLNRERVRNFCEKKKTIENQSSMEEDIAVAYKTPQEKHLEKFRGFFQKVPERKKQWFTSLPIPQGFFLGKKRAPLKQTDQLMTPQ